MGGYKEKEKGGILCLCLFGGINSVAKIERKGGDYQGGGPNSVVQIRKRKWGWRLSRGGRGGGLIPWFTFKKERGRDWFRKGVGVDGKMLHILYLQL